MSEPKKISFGFSKLARKSNLVVGKQPVKEKEKKVELIDCLEGQSIKIRDAIEINDGPLVIPVQGNDKNLLDRVREANELKDRSRKKYGESEKVIEDMRPDSELTLDELAARQLLREAKNFSGPKKDVKIYSLPAIEDKLILEGSVEPTIDDYENVPISEYGLAMLRGMGWKDGEGVGKSTSVGLVAAPELRPKGMGLGANKMVSGEKQEKPATDKDGNELSLKKGIHAKVIAGKEKGNYCMVQGLDDEGGRVIVKMALKGDILSLNEFLLLPVTADEYSKYSKVLNNAKYEEFKEKTANPNDDHKNGKIQFENPANSITKQSRKNNRSRSRSNSLENLKNKETDNKNLRRENRERSQEKYDRKRESSYDSYYKNKKYGKTKDKGESSLNHENKLKRKEKFRGRRGSSSNSDYSSRKYETTKKSRDSSSDSDRNTRKFDKSSRRNRDSSSELDYKTNEKPRKGDSKYKTNEKLRKYRDSSSDSNYKTNEKLKKHRDSSSESNYKTRKYEKSKSRRDSSYDSEDDRKSSRRKKYRDSDEESYERKSRRDKERKHTDEETYRGNKNRGGDNYERNHRRDKESKYRDDSSEEWERKNKDKDRDSERRDRKKKQKKNKSRSRSRSPKRKSRKNDGYSSDDSEDKYGRKKSSKKKKSKKRSRSSSSEEDCRKSSRSRRDRSYSSEELSSDDQRRRRRNR